MMPSFARISALVSMIVTVGHCVTIPPANRLKGDVSMFNHPGLNPVPPSDVRASVLANPDLNGTAKQFIADATPVAPHFVIYGDRFVSGLTGPPAASAIKVSVVILSDRCLSHH